MVPQTTEQHVAIAFSAPTQAALRDQLHAAQERWRGGASTTLPQLAAAQAREQQRASHRLVVCAASIDDALQALDHARAGGAPAACPGGARLFAGSPERAAALAMMFPGQGAQRVGLLRELHQWLPTFRTALDTLLGVCDAYLPRPALTYLYPTLDGSRSAKVEAEHALQATQVCQPIMAALGLALHETLGWLGVQASFALGHSLGELVAASAVGMLEPSQAVSFVAQRGAIMASHGAAEGGGEHDTGAMAAILGGVAEVEALLMGTDVVVANVNEPGQTVVSGPTQAVDEVVRRSKDARMVARKLRVSHAFHSPLVAPAADTLRAVIEALPLRDGRVPLISAVPEVVAGGSRRAETVRATFVRHATSRVDFVGALRSARDAGAEFFLEVGAGTTLTGFATATLTAVATCSLVGARGDDRRAMTEALAQLFVHGHPVAFERLYT